MEFTPQPNGHDSGVRPVEQVGFDMLRTLVAARQASSPTVRALQSVRPAEPLSMDPASMAVLTGRRSPASAVMGGAFSYHCADVHPVAIEGESHG